VISGYHVHFVRTRQKVFGRDKVKEMGYERGEPSRIVIEWRHVDWGDLQCGRCSDTGTNLWNVIVELSQGNLLDEVELEVQNTLLPMDRIAESNTLLINGIPIEHIIGADITSTDCQECSDFTGEPIVCQAAEAERDIFEAIPQEVLRAAILKALKRQQ